MIIRNKSILLLLTKIYSWATEEDRTLDQDHVNYS